MQNEVLGYIIFIAALVISLMLDIFIFSKNNQETSLTSAVKQYFFWVAIALGYAIFLYQQYGPNKSVLYISSYLMEMSLSIDNIFVFVLVFSSLKIKKENIGFLLMIGIVVAILLRILFISLGIALVREFHWVMYIFGIFLIYSGFKLFFYDHQDEQDITEGKTYKLIRKYLRYTDIEPEGKFTIKKNNKVYFTKLSLVILLIGFTDIVFALDSIPAVFAITTDNLIVYSSNIFAVLGLRALFFIVQNMANKFDYLQQGIAVVLLYIGAKMFLDLIHIEIPTYISLLVIILCLSGGILYSIKYDKPIKPNKH
ncbi:MAG: TerC/Alx family metal homeostasis membrane protein [Chitinophagaceae bacterium]